MRDLAKGPCRLARPLFSATVPRRLEQKVALGPSQALSKLVVWGQSSPALSAAFLRLVADGASPWSASLARQPAISPFGDGRRFALVGKPGSSASHFFVWLRTALCPGRPGWLVR